MKILVLVQFVPDLVEELVIDPGGCRLDPYSIRWKLNEFDDHAIEQAVLLKEKFGGQVIVAAPACEGAEDALFTAVAKGADRVIKLDLDPEAKIDVHGLVQAFLPLARELAPDLVLTGVQAYHSLDGCFGSILAAFLGWPYVGYVSSIQSTADGVSLRKEYPGGLTARLEARLPIVVGVQAAETPPRYVPIARVRQAMKAARIEDLSPEPVAQPGLALSRLYPPQTGSHAEMLEGDLEQVADTLVEILREQGLI